MPESRFPQMTADFGRRPGRVVAALCAAQALFWTLAPALSHNALPLDTVEMLVWGREGVVATYKHPNLPGLLLEAARLASFGATWTAYAVTQACIVATFAAVYLLGRDLLGPARALAGTLLLTGIYYFSWPTPEMKHNLMEMPLWAWLCLALWRSTRSGRLSWWIALAAFAGLAVWAKYSAAVALAAAAAWICADAQARARLATPQPWIGLAAFAAIVAPQAAFLIETDLLPLEYASGRAGRADGPAQFLLAQIANHGAFFVMAAVAGLFGAGAVRSSSSPDARRFLAIMGLCPALLAAALATAAGTGLRDMWGMPMFNLSGLLLVALFPGRLNETGLRRLTAFSFLLVAAIPAAYAASVLWRGALSDRPSRAVWPQAAISRALTEAWVRETGRPLRIVAGPTWEAGLVALGAPGSPSVLIDGSVRKSPWVNAADVARFGALAVWRTGAPPAPDLQALIGGLPVRRETFRWTDSVNARPIRLSWTAILPRASERRRSRSRDR